MGTAMSCAKRTLGLCGTFLLSAAVFWLPSVALHWSRRHAFGAVDVAILSVVMPLTALILVAVGRMWLQKEVRSPFPSILVLAAIWIGGPTAMYISAAATGGGFARGNALEIVIALTMLFPLGTALLSFYDGSVIGVMIASVELSWMCVSALVRRLWEQDSSGAGVMRRLGRGRGARQGDSDESERSVEKLQ